MWNIKRVDIYQTRPGWRAGNLRAAPLIHLHGEISESALFLHYGNGNLNELATELSCWREYQGIISGRSCAYILVMSSWTCVFSAGCPTLFLGIATGEIVKGVKRPSPNSGWKKTQPSVAPLIGIVNHIRSKDTWGNTGENETIMWQRNPTGTDVE